jgi:general nucleoside transport system permease protein
VLHIATPLILGTLGELRCKRAGVPDLGIERITVAGAFTGGLAVDQGGVPWSGVFAAVAAVAAATGAAFGLPHALLTVTLALSQHGAGLGITLLATSLARSCLPRRLPEGRPPADPPAVRGDGRAAHPGAERAVAAHAAPARALARAIAWLLYRTPAGLALRRVGENPDRGRVCAALVVFAFCDALQLRLQQSCGSLFRVELPCQPCLMLPCAMAIAALVLVARRAANPQALMKPERKGER